LWKMLDPAVNAKVTVQQRGIVYVAIEFFGDRDGHLRPFPAANSSSWLSKAGGGNRGEIIELVLALNSTIRGVRLSNGTTLVVNRSNVHGLGKGIFTTAGDVVEGDLIESLGGSTERFIDFKGIDASFELVQLKRVGDGLLDRKYEDFIFVAEEGVTFPGNWISDLQRLNQIFLAAGRPEIRFGSVAGF